MKYSTAFKYIDLYMVSLYIIVWKGRKYIERELKEKYIYIYIYMSICRLINRVECNAVITFYFQFRAFGWFSYVNFLMHQMVLDVGQT